MAAPRAKAADKPKEGAAAQIGVACRREAKWIGGVAMDVIPPDPDRALLAELLRIEPWMRKFQTGPNRLHFNEFWGAHLDPTCDLVVATSARHVLIRAPYPKPIPATLYVEIDSFASAMRTVAAEVWRLDERSNELAIVREIKLPHQRNLMNADAPQWLAGLEIGNAVHQCINALDRFAPIVADILEYKSTALALQNWGRRELAGVIQEINWGRR